MLCDERGRSLAYTLRFPLLCAMAALSVAACSSGLPRPPRGSIPRDTEVEEVPYPPPPARVETIPPRKDRLEVWVDGQWDWDGKAWKWVAGAWETPPADATFTPWTTQRRSDGRLYFVRATWRAKDGRPLQKGPGGLACPAPRAEEAAQ